MKKRKPLAIVFALLEIALVPVFILSFAILIPIAFRPFYYMQIGPLGIVESSGFSEAQILQAFNDVLDYIWFHAPFKMGDLRYTEEGMAHFADCVPLFHLDLILFLVSGGVLLLFFILRKTNLVKPYAFFHFPPLFYGAILLLLFVAGIGVYGLIDFDGLFVLFHSVFFPGKSNWIFDERVDQFILILPVGFFVNTAIYIGSVCALLTGGCIGYGIAAKIESKRDICYGE